MYHALGDPHLKNVITDTHKQREILLVDTM